MFAIKTPNTIKATLLPIKVVVKKRDGLRMKNIVNRAPVSPFWLSSSNRKRLAAKKAISNPEKKAENSNVSMITLNGLIKQLQK